MIKRVFIEPGCVVCKACELTCPDVFHVTSQQCLVREGVQLEPYEDKIREASAVCPVDVIRVE